MKAGFGGHETNERDRAVSLILLLVRASLDNISTWLAGDLHQRCGVSHAG
jgi:hypothetical protein